MLKEKKGKKKSRRNREGGKPKERCLGPFIWGDYDKCLPFCWAVHSHCSVGALGDKTVFEREKRQTDRQTENDRHLAIYSLRGSAALRTGAEGEMS